MWRLSEGLDPNYHECVNKVAVIYMLCSYNSTSIGLGHGMYSVFSCTCSVRRLFGALTRAEPFTRATRSSPRRRWRIRVPVRLSLPLINERPYIMTLECEVHRLIPPEEFLGEGLINDKISVS